MAQIWSIHQSKAVIFYFVTKKFWVGFLKILWETDKAHFTNSNLVCVFTHNLNLKIWNLVCLFSTKCSKTQLKIFSCHNRKSELSIYGLIISVPLAKIMLYHFEELKVTLVLCLFPTKFSKIRLQIFSCQNRKSELSIDGLIISVPLLTFGVRKRQKFFVK